MEARDRLANEITCHQRIDQTTHAETCNARDGDVAQARACAALDRGFLGHEVQRKEHQNDGDHFDRNLCQRKVGCGQVVEAHRHDQTNHTDQHQCQQAVAMHCHHKARGDQQAGPAKDRDQPDILQRARRCRQCAGLVGIE